MAAAAPAALPCPDREKVAAGLDYGAAAQRERACLPFLHRKPDRVEIECGCIAFCPHSEGPLSRACLGDTVWGGPGLTDLCPISHGIA